MCAPYQRFVGNLSLETIYARSALMSASQTSRHNAVIRCDFIFRIII